MRLLVEEDEVLLAGRVIAVEIDDRHVADELTTGCGLEQRREPLERVDGPERAVLGVGREHLEPAVLHELTAEQHVARAHGVELDEVGDPFLGHLGLRFGSGTFILRELHYRHRRPAVGPITFRTRRETVHDLALRPRARQADRSVT